MEENVWKKVIDLCNGAPLDFRFREPEATHDEMRSRKKSTEGNGSQEVNDLRKMTFLPHGIAADSPILTPLPSSDRNSELGLFLAACPFVGGKWR